MPNWCFNTITVTGAKIERILHKTKSGAFKLSFEKIKPIPKELKITASSENENAIAVYFSEKFSRVLPSKENMDLVKQHLDIFEMTAYKNLPSALETIEKYKNQTDPRELDDLCQ